MDIIKYIQLLIQNGKMSYSCVQWRIQYLIGWGGLHSGGLGDMEYP